MTKALYVHVPFCAHICYYCDFCHSIYQKDRAHRWFEAFKREFKERVDDEVSTIYIGGGTPTALDDDLLEELLKTLACVHDPDKEYTIEINPETLNAKKVELLKRYGINRASIGMISSNDKELASLGRRHSFSDVTRTVELLKRYGIDNYSLDILYSFPGETFENYKKNVLMKYFYFGIDCLNTGSRLSYRSFDELPHRLFGRHDGQLVSEAWNGFS